MPVNTKKSLSKRSGKWEVETEESYGSLKFSQSHENLYIKWIR